MWVATVSDRTTPIPAVELAFLLRGGDYLILNGSYNIRVNAHMKLLDESVPRFRTYHGASDKPHLHIHGQRRRPTSSPLSRNPLPMRLQQTISDSRRSRHHGDGNYT